jgi:hypothetical protein
MRGTVRVVTAKTTLNFCCDKVLACPTIFLNRQTIRSMFHFIISAMRSGSTWLTRALNRHPDIFATEQRLFGRFAEIWPNPNGSHSPRITLDEYVQATAMHYLFDELGWKRREYVERIQQQLLVFFSRFAREHSGKSVVVDKVTPYLGTGERVIDSIRQFVPGAKLIYLVRDGRDVATSGTFDWLARADRQSDRYRCFIERESDLSLNRFFNDEELHTWARYWSETYHAVQKWSGPLLEVRYEAMLEDQAAVLQQIFQFLGVNADQELARQAAEAVSFERITGRPRGQSEPGAKARKGIAGDWKNYFTLCDGHRFDRDTEGLLYTLGYETSETWLEQLSEKL